MCGGRLRRQQRLRSPRDFQRVNQEGRRRSSSHFVVLWAPPGPGTAGEASRLGVTVSRRVGGAVVRNRLKRRIREWFRTCCEMPGNGGDMVVIARPTAAGLDAADVARQLSRLLDSLREG